MHTALTATNATPRHRQQPRSATPSSDAKYECRQYNQLRPITPRWFHVLLNSLFKVLCNFPSRYLFAIGLVLIFSFRCGIPPTLSCTSKQLDSKTRPITAANTRTGLTPSLEVAFQPTSGYRYGEKTRLNATPCHHTMIQALLR